MINMHTASVPVFARMLKSTHLWLDKAAAFAEQKKFDPAVLMQARLAPDQFAFVRQVQIATDHAKGCSARLAGVDVPTYEDSEVTIAELKARLDKTIAFIESLPAEKFQGSETKDIVLPSPRGERRYIGEEYLQFFAMANFYFHLTHAYAILRHNGVDVGKGDYLGGATK